MHYQLWDVDSGNLIETFPSEAEAIQGVRELLAVNAPDLAQSLALGAMYDEGEPGTRDLPPVLEGDELLLLVRVWDGASGELIAGPADAIRRGEVI